MFNFFKRKTPIENQVQRVLDKAQLYGRPFMDFVEKMSLEGAVLTLQVRICEGDDTAVLEALYHQLQQTFYPMGVVELNMNVSVASQSTQPQTEPSNNHSTQTKTDAPMSTKDDAVKIHHTAPAQKADETKSAPKQSELAAHPRIANIVVIASGKGGVGKSTTTVNIALGLQKLGKKVAILDADIYGPSIPAMLGIADKKPAVENGQFIPIDAQGIAVLSIGNLIDSEQTPIAWRGIKATGALMQLYQQTDWPRLDYLLIDMPPGTGDIQLTLAQKIPVNAAVVVTTPQHIALLDAQKGIEMFIKTQIPVLGVVENMALHICSNCGHSEAIFGQGGGEQMAEQYQVPLLGQLPLQVQIRQCMDVGTPSQLDTQTLQYYLDIAEKIDLGVHKFRKKPTQRFF